MNQTLPVQNLPYGRQSIDDGDVAAVVDALRSNYLTTGPMVPAFEDAICRVTGARHAVAVSNGTAALHLAARAVGLTEGTWTVVPAVTFLATANAVRLTGGEVVFADVDPKTGLMTAETFEAALQRAPGPVKAAIPVHLAGPSADMAALSSVARKHGIVLIEDAAHAIGTQTATGRTGDCAHSRMTCFSFHPVKTVTTGEGGAITTNDSFLASALRCDRSHGMIREQADLADLSLSCDAHGRINPWSYEMHAPGLNYRLCDIQAALGLSQISKLSAFVAARAQLKSFYDERLTRHAPLIETPVAAGDQRPAWHLYPVNVDFESARLTRAEVVRKLSAVGIGTQVHYIPLHKQPYYAARYGRLDLPGAERRYARTLSLPLFPGMTQSDAELVATELERVLGF